MVFCTPPPSSWPCSYRGASITLADLTFRLISSAATLGDDAILSVGATNSQLYPFVDSPQLAFDDYRPSLQDASGNVWVEASAPLGLLAYAEPGDVLNTALLTGTTVQAAIKVCAR